MVFIVFGNGLMCSGELKPMVIDCLHNLYIDHSAELFSNDSNEFIVVSGGTNLGMYKKSEALMMYEYLTNILKIPASKIFKEILSADQLEQYFFTRDMLKGLSKSMTHNLLHNSGNNHYIDPEPFENIKIFCPDYQTKRHVLFSRSVFDGLPWNIEIRGDDKIKYTINDSVYEKYIIDNFTSNYENRKKAWPLSSTEISNRLKVAPKSFELTDSTD